MIRIKYPLMTLLALFFWSLSVASPSAPLAQEKTNPRGTLRVVDLMDMGASLIGNYKEG
jgi:hypothetical protein